MSDATHRWPPRRPHAVHGTKARRLSPVKLNHVGGAGGCRADFCNPARWRHGRANFWRAPSPGRRPGRWRHLQTPRVTRSSHHGLRFGTKKRTAAEQGRLFFRGGLLLEFDFICITTTTTRAEKTLSGQSRRWMGTSSRPAADNLCWLRL